MQKQSCDTCVRWLCGILFAAFAFCWLFFFQKDLLNAEINLLFAGNGSLRGQLSGSHLIVSLSLTVIALLFAIPGKILLRLKKGLYACNYLFSAAFLGVITGFDGDSFLGQTYTEWIVTGAFMLVIFLVCKIVASVPRSEYNDRPRTLAGNLLLMSLLFCMTGYLGNTDENLHRRLRMEKMYAAGEYSSLLDYGRYEEESDPYIDLLRAKAMLGLPSEPNPDGSQIGELLFCYSISNPKVLSKGLKDLKDEQAYLAACLLDKDLVSFSDTLYHNAYKVIPKFFMQALVVANDSIAAALFPGQFAEEQSVYNAFCETLEPLESESSQFQANSTFITYHETYFWFYTFK